MFKVAPLRDAISSKNQRYTKTFPQPHWMESHCQQDTEGGSFGSPDLKKKKKKEKDKQHLMK